MKILIVTMAILMIFSMFMVFQLDNNLYIRELENLKYVTDEASSTALQFYDEVQFSHGYKYFNKAEGNKAIYYLITENLNLNSDLTPNKYWQDTIEYYVYYIDDSSTMTTYKDGLLQSQVPITFNYMFTEPLTGYKKLITEPTVIVTINAGRPKFRLPFITMSDAVRTSAYEYLERI